MDSSSGCGGAPAEARRCGRAARARCCLLGLAGAVEHHASTLFAVLGCGRPRRAARFC